MANVAQKAISANDIENGDALATVNQQGTAQSLDRHEYETNSLTKINAVLGDRLDNPTYYGA